VCLENDRYGCPNKPQVFTDESKLVSLFGIQLFDGLDAEASRERMETRRPRTGFVFPGNPGEHFVVGSADPAPQAGQLCSITQNDTTCHWTPISTVADGRAVPTGARSV
jgi:hypothetical protein